jgi:tRNA threonylcarbamoyladenosine biosynthesis protein TsaE
MGLGHVSRVHRCLSFSLAEGKKGMSRQTTLFIKSEGELGLAVEALLHFAEGRKKIALKGDLGAGKTAFVKAFCRRLKVAENVSSPTFALVNEYVYEDENGQSRLIHHLDLYRLRSMDEALNIGVEDYLYDNGYCFIEWPEIVADLLPKDMVFMEITAQEDGSRQFSFFNNIDLIC